MSQPGLFHRALILLVAARYYLLLLLAIYLFLQRLLTYRRLRHIPGPFLARFSMLWNMKAAASGRMCEELEVLCRKYGTFRPANRRSLHSTGANSVLAEQGPLVRINGNTLATNDPEAITRMGVVRSPYRRSNEYKAARLDPTSETVLSVLDETKHTELRTKMSAGYSGKDNPQLEKCIDNRLLDLVKLIEDKYISEGSRLRPMDFARKAQYFTLDVITDIAFGEPFGDLTADEDVHEYLTTIDRLLPVLHWITVFPDIADLAAIPWIGRMFLPSSGDHVGVGKVMGVAKKAVAERYRPGAKIQADMVGSFLRHGITQEEAETASLLQIIAGAETTATAMRCTILHIITQPRVYATLQSEIDEAVRTNRISTPIRDSEARELPYLIACIREGLRIWPPAPSTFAKVVPPEGDTLAGIFVPGGTNVSICVWGVQRNKSVFGEDVDVYRPERWLEVSEEQRGRMERTNDLIFGPGRYQCLGRSIAMIELRKVFVEVREVTNERTFSSCVANTVAIAPAPLRPGADESFAAMEIQKHGNMAAVRFTIAHIQACLVLLQLSGGSKSHLRELQLYPRFLPTFSTAGGDAPTRYYCAIQRR